MDIQFSVVTYRQPEQLQRLYNSLWNSYGPLSEDNFLIINNHSSFKSPGPSSVIDNTLRHDHSLGYLSRSWNQCFLHGFGSSINPKTEWLMLIQSDVVFERDWRDRLSKIVKERDLLFVAAGPGDQAMLFNIEAMRRVGWWDERFCGIGFHEYDYFIRAFLQLRNQCAMQGHHGMLSHNWTPDMKFIARQVEDGSGHTSKLNEQLWHHLLNKWGDYFINSICGIGSSKIDRWTQIADDTFWKAPREYNWYPHFFLDDERNYKDLYLYYTAVQSKKLEIHTHGLGGAVDGDTVSNAETTRPLDLA